MANPLKTHWHKISWVLTALVLILYLLASVFFYLLFLSAPNEGDRKFWYQMLVIIMPALAGLGIGHMWVLGVRKKIAIPIIVAVAIVLALIAGSILIRVKTGNQWFSLEAEGSPILRITFSGAFFFVVAAVPAFLRPAIFGWFRSNREDLNEVVTSPLAKGLTTAISLAPAVIAYFSGTPPPPGAGQ